MNYLAPFLLTRLLLPNLVGVPARIVNVASVGQAPIDFDDIMLTGRWDGQRAYRQSKLALIMFTLDLAEELRIGGVSVNALHPATFMATTMVRESGVTPWSTVEEGADAIVQIAISPGLAGQTGLFFDGQQPARAHAQAYDAQARLRLRALSFDLVGLDPAQSAQRETTGANQPGPAAASLAHIPSGDIPTID